MRARQLPVLLLFLSLYGCSYGYDVKAELIDGEIVFTSDKDWFRERCVRDVEVVANDREQKAQAAEGDDKSLVGYGTYWSVRLGYHCDNRFPITYGSTLQGEGLPDESTILVSPKPLKVGVVYTVSTVSGATGYGAGRFVIQSDGTVLNLGYP